MGVETIFHAKCIHKKCAKSLKKYWQKCRASFVVVVAKIFYYFYLHLTWNVSCLVGILLILVSSWHLESSTFLKKTIIYRLNNLQSQRKKNKLNSLVKKFTHLSLANRKSFSSLCHQKLSNVQQYAQGMFFKTIKEVQTIQLWRVPPFDFFK